VDGQPRFAPPRDRRPETGDRTAVERFLIESGSAFDALHLLPLGET
jgi:hypothetical protein